MTPETQIRSNTVVGTPTKAEERILEICENESCHSWYCIGFWDSIFDFKVGLADSFVRNKGQVSDQKALNILKDTPIFLGQIYTHNRKGKGSNKQDYMRGVEDAVFLLRNKIRKSGTADLFEHLIELWFPELEFVTYLYPNHVALQIIE